MNYILAALILYVIVQVHGLHYKNMLQEKLIKDFWTALQALKLQVVNSEVGSMDETFIAAFERMDERLGRLEPMSDAQQ